MSVAKTCMLFSLFLAVISLLLQTISIFCPGWFIAETNDFSINIAVWFVIYCGRKENITETQAPCEILTHRKALGLYRSKIVSTLGTSFRSMIGTQVQVTSALLLALGALLLIIFQLRTFQQQTTGRPTIYDKEPRGACNLRSKFIYSGGFSAIFQLFSAVLLGLVILDFGKRYFSQEQNVVETPYMLFIAGLGVVTSGLCGFIELIIAFRTKENPIQRQDIENDKLQTSQQLLPLGQGQSSAQGHSGDCDLSHRDSPVRNLSIDDGDYYGQDYNVENPAFCTQGARKSCQSNKLFPGYRLGRNNLQGHNKKWWRKVAFASAPYL